MGWRVYHELRHQRRDKSYRLAQGVFIYSFWLVPFAFCFCFEPGKGSQRTISAQIRHRSFWPSFRKISTFDTSYLPARAVSTPAAISIKKIQTSIYTSKTPRKSHRSLSGAPLLVLSKHRPFGYNTNGRSHQMKEWQKVRQKERQLNAVVAPMRGDHWTIRRCEVLVRVVNIVLFFWLSSTCNGRQFKLKMCGGWGKESRRRRRRRRRRKVRFHANFRSAWLTLINWLAYFVESAHLYITERTREESR